jgi:uncharacterized protein involved in exopolysaccharide biosynthesis
MSADSTPTQTISGRDEASWDDILRFFAGYWRLLAIGAITGGALGVAIASLQTKLYAAQATIVVVEEDMASSLLGGMPSGVSALAAASGISLADSSRKNEYLGVLKSNALLRAFIAERNLIPKLFAERWDEQAGQWKTSWWRGVPNLEAAVARFGKKVRSITEDRRAGLVRLEILWRDRLEAAEWANELVRRANENLRGRAIQEADDSVALLRRELASAQSIELQQGINKLIEAQIKNGTAAKVRPEFAFRIVDAAVAPNPEVVAWPRNRIFGGAGLVLGLMAALLAAVLRSRAAAARARAAG